MQSLCPNTNPKLHLYFLRRYCHISRRSKYPLLINGVKPGLRWSKQVVGSLGKFKVTIFFLSKLKLKSSIRSFSIRWRHNSNVFILAFISRLDAYIITTFSKLVQLHRKISPSIGITANILISLLEHHKHPGIELYSFGGICGIVESHHLHHFFEIE